MSGPFDRALLSYGHHHAVGGSDKGAFFVRPSMPKDGRSPAFLFYPEDFSADGKVEAMSTEQVGAYILLLCKAWHEKPAGSVPDNDVILARWARLDLEQWKASREVILSPFTVGADGRLYQGRMVQEHRKLQAAKKKRERAARIGAHHRWDDGSNRIAIALQPDQNGNAKTMRKNAISSSSSSSIPIPREEEETLAHADDLEPRLSPIGQVLCHVAALDVDLLSPLRWLDLQTAITVHTKAGHTPDDILRFGKRWAEVYPQRSAPHLGQIGDEWARVMSSNGSASVTKDKAAAYVGASSPTEPEHCGKPARFTYTWPNCEPAVCCEQCLAEITQHAGALGLTVKTSPLQGEAICP